MTNRLTNADLAAADRLWGRCPSCDKERRVLPDGHVARHRRYTSALPGMEPCPGSNAAPARILMTRKQGEKQ